MMLGGNALLSRRSGLDITSIGYDSRKSNSTASGDLGDLGDILGKDDSHLFIIFATVTSLAFLVTIVLFVFVVRSTRKIKRAISASDDDNTQTIYKIYRNTQAHNALTTLVMFACIGLFLFLAANLTMMGMPKDLPTYLAYLFGVLVVAVLFQLWNVFNLKKKFPPMFESGADEEEAVELDDIASESD
ncbi:hypothetical protein IL306_013884 [Fusarium sp. DS 682]|nr:hypothetical protein IL306_013884 [Fusarium sp. DS 682]